MACSQTTLVSVDTSTVCLNDVGAQQAAGVGDDRFTAEVCIKHLVKHAHLHQLSSATYLLRVLFVI